MENSPYRQINKTEMKHAYIISQTSLEKAIIGNIKSLLFTSVVVNDTWVKYQTL